MEGTLERTSSVSDFLADPFGRYYLGRRHCVFARSPTLIGFASWGRPDTDDVSELLHLCEIGLRPGMPHRFLVDVRGLELVLPSTFGLFVTYTRKHREVLKQNIVRQAQLRPEGLVGAIISGFSQVARLSYPERVFGDVEEALAWLQVEPQEGVELVSELDSQRCVRELCCRGEAPGRAQRFGRGCDREGGAPARTVDPELAARAPSGGHDLPDRAQLVPDPPRPGAAPGRRARPELDLGGGGLLVGAALRNGIPPRGRRYAERVARSQPRVTLSARETPAPTDRP